MKAITTTQMRELERIAASEYDIAPLELMRRAGEGVAATVEYLAEKARGRDCFIQLVAGRGNNGGDVFAAAQLLHEDEYEIEVLLAGSAADIKGDALRHLGKMRAVGIPLVELPTKESWEDALRDASSGEIIVDGILGTGASGPPRGPAAAAIHYINTLSDDNLVVSIDVPSGLDADSGQAPGEAVVADITCLIGMPKVGLLSPAAIPYVGSMDVVGIGIPLELTTGFEATRHMITGWDVRRMLPRRQRAAHKGNFGHLLVVGGAAGYAGAPALAAQAALRSGAGLVSALVPQGIQGTVAGSALELMVHGGNETTQGSLASSALDAWMMKLEAYSAIVAGPGMTRHGDTAMWVKTLLRQSKHPLVLDADALNVLEGDPRSLALASCPVIITPHPAELARLLKCDASQIQADREAAVREATKLTRCIVVLKGAGTLVGQQEKPLHVNVCGNPGMATAGMGDVLAGLIGGLLAQGLDPFDAACAGVFLHGRSGDNAMWRRSQASLLARDVLEELPGTMREVTVR